MSETQKTAVIFGLANKRSIAWAIAQKMQEAGWRLAITYQNERLEQEAKDLITELPGAEGFMCDVTSDEQIAATIREAEGAVRRAARAGAQRGVCAGGGVKGRVSEYERAKDSGWRMKSACIR